MKRKSNQVLAVVGPTALGKTDTALKLAELFNGELISCDSRQIYKGLDIGTGKLPGSEVKIKKAEGFWEMDEIKIWMYDVADPKVQFSVKEYLEYTTPIVEDLLERGKLPIIVGGTGLYVQGLLEGIDTPGGSDEQLRKKLEVLPVGELQDKLQTLSPVLFESMNESDRANKRRLVRKIELIYMYGYTGKKIQNSKVKNQKWDILKIGLTAPRPLIYQHIDSRLLARIDQGLIKEGEDLHKKGLTLKRMRELGLEYGELADILEGKISYEEFVERLKTKIHRYAKRQETWFKKKKDIYWFDITEEDWFQRLERLVYPWYHALTHE